MTSTRVGYQLTVNVTRNVSVDSGQHIVQQYQIRTGVDSTGKGDASSLATAQLVRVSITFRQPKRITHRDTLFSHLRHITVRKKGQVRSERASWGLGVR